MVPATYIGRLLTSFCCICGLIVMALPVSIIANNFTVFYSEQRKVDALLKFKKETKSSTLKSAETNQQEAQEDTKFRL